MGEVDSLRRKAIHHSGSFSICNKPCFANDRWAQTSQWMPDGLRRTFLRQFLYFSIWFPCHSLVLAVLSYHAVRSFIDASMALTHQVGALFSERKVRLTETNHSRLYLLPPIRWLFHSAYLLFLFFSLHLISVAAKIVLHLQCTPFFEAPETARLIQLILASQKKRATAEAICKLSSQEWVFVFSMWFAFCLAESLLVELQRASNSFVGVWVGTYRKPSSTYGENVRDLNTRVLTNILSDHPPDSKCIAFWAKKSRRAYLHAFWTNVK
jgi:hypothetical protein